MGTTSLALLYKCATYWITSYCVGVWLMHTYIATRTILDCPHKTELKTLNSDVNLHIIYVVTKWRRHSCMYEFCLKWLRIIFICHIAYIEYYPVRRLKHVNVIHAAEILLTNIEALFIMTFIFCIFYYKCNVFVWLYAAPWCVRGPTTDCESKGLRIIFQFWMVFEFE